MGASSISSINVDRFDPRERLEFEVSQLADGSLNPSRRAAVEAALAGDDELAALYAEFIGLQDVLTRAPDDAVLDRMGPKLTADIMAVVRAEAQGEDAPMVLTPAASREASWWRNWGVTAMAAAAALTVGLSFGLLALVDTGGGGRGGDDYVAQTDPAPTTPDPVLEVSGPALAAVPDDSITDVSVQDEPVTAILSVSGVSGADLTAAYSPQSVPTEGPESVISSFPDYAAVYNAAVVVERPSRVSIASGNVIED